MLAVVQSQVMAWPSWTWEDLGIDGKTARKGALWYQVHGLAKSGHKQGSAKDYVWVKIMSSLIIEPAIAS